MFSSDRRYSVWATTPSHKCILIRSPKSDKLGLQQNIDIFFWGVDYINIPFSFTGLILRKATESETKNILSSTDKERIFEQVFTIESSGRVFFIVAVNYVIKENYNDIFDPIVWDRNP